MRVNLTEIEISNENRELLQKFFNEHLDWIYSTDLLDYKNIKIFGNLLAKFIVDNKLQRNIIFKLFLAEIRYDELAYQVTKDCSWIKDSRKTYASISPDKQKKSGIFISFTIKKWMFESSNIPYTKSRKK